MSTSIRAHHSDGEDHFYCSHCKQLVCNTISGTNQRNHCPKCLWSLHVDFQIGDRRSVCQSPMEPVAVWVKANGEWSIVHRCKGCGALRANRIAGDDSEILLLSLALRPLALPPFPLDRLNIKI